MSVVVGDTVLAEWVNTIPAADAGVVGGVIVGGGATITRAITFVSGRFTSTPAIVAMASTSTPDNVDVAVAGASTTGATLYITSDSGGTYGLNWIAIQQGY